MAWHQECAPAVLEKAQVVHECREIVFAAAEAKPGDTIKAQIFNAQRNLGIDYGKVWRAWRLRGGPKLLRELRVAYADFLTRFEAREAAELRRSQREWEARLARLEQRIVDEAEEPALSRGDQTIRHRLAKPRAAGRAVHS